MTSDRTFGETLEIIANNYRMFGPWQTAGSLILHLLQDGLLSNDEFDERFGVHTRGDVTPEAAGITDPRLREAAILYVPIREKALDTVLRKTLVERDPSRLTFVDLGCGKGRALIIASRYPLARIVGVELSESLAQAARENVRSYLGQSRPAAPIHCRELAVECASATACDFPDSDLLVYMYRPFTGEVFTAALDNLERFQRATGRRVTIMLCCPAEEYLLERHRAFSKVSKFRVIDAEYNWVVYEGTALVRPLARTPVVTPLEKDISA